MSPLRSRAGAALASALLLSTTTEVLAAPCGRPDVDLTFPPLDASDVPNNAQLSAHYASPALYDDEPVSLTDSNEQEVAIAVSYDEAESTLRASPEEPLASGFHQLVWPGLRSLSSGGMGRGSTVGFFVQNGEDTAAPRFAGLSKIDWDLSRDSDPCLDRLEDRFVFELELGPASDDAGTGLLQLLVFETVDPAAPSQTEPSRVALSAVPENGKLEIKRPAKKAGKTCFAAVVQDLVGNVSGGGEVEVCAKTKRPPFFDGCTLAQTPPAGSSTNDRVWVFLALALGLRRRGSSAGSRAARARH
jgi:hypothetical protein